MVLLMSVIIACLAIGGGRQHLWIDVYFYVVVCIGLCFIALAIFFYRKFKKEVAEELKNHCRSLTQRYRGLEVCCKVPGCRSVLPIENNTNLFFHFRTRIRVPRFLL